MNPAKIVICKATSDDVQTISEITDASYGKWVPLIGRKPLPMMADYGRMAIENEIWLLSVDEQAAGVLVLVYEAESTLIYSVAIKPEYQKKGLGHRLLDLAEECAKRLGLAYERRFTGYGDLATTLSQVAQAQ